MVVVVVAIAGVAMVAPSTSSSEAFPGANGKIAYVKAVDDTFEVTQIWSMDPDGTNQVQLTDPVKAADDEPQWSPDGTRIAFSRDTGDASSVWVMNADGSGETELTPSTGYEGGASWSPDGTKLVYVTNPVPQLGLGPALWTMNADGSGQTQITTGNRFDRWPSWSPDGSRIVFSRQDLKSTATEIWLVDPDGSNADQLTNSGDQTLQSFNPSWSPDGTQIVYVYRAGNEYFVKVMNAGGSGQQVIAGPGANGPKWSPDGRIIAFSTFGGSDNGIWTMATDGSGQAPLITGLVYGPAWQRIVVPVSPTTTAAPPTTTAASPAAAAAAAPTFTG